MAREKVCQSNMSWSLSVVGASGADKLMRARGPFGDNVVNCSGVGKNTKCEYKMDSQETLQNLFGE